MLIGRSRISGALLFHAGRCLSAFLLAAAFEREFPINAAALGASGQNQTDESGAPSAISRSSAARGGFEACDSIH
jgi:hypothetical protein